MTIDVKARRVGPREKRPKVKRAKRVDATGRVDLLASRIVDEYMRTANPVVQAVHRQLKPELDEIFRSALGPRNPKARKVREVVRRGVDLIADVYIAKMEQAARAVPPEGGRAA